MKGLIILMCLCGLSACSDTKTVSCGIITEVECDYTTFRCNFKTDVGWESISSSQVIKGETICLCEGDNLLGRVLKSKECD